MNRREFSDRDLIEAIRQGGTACDQAMRYLYRRHVDQLVGFMTARNGSEEEAKDVVQDAMVNLLMSIRQGKFEGKSSLHTYLYAISKNLWYRRFNRSLRADDYKASLKGNEIDAVNPELLLLEQDQQAKLNELMDQLKQKCREVLSLWARKYSMKEIAEQLGYGSEQVVRNKKNHCLKELKQLVEAHPQVRKLVREFVS